MSADEFNYTCMGGETAIQGVDDRADMAETCRTFTLLGNKGTLLSVLQHLVISVLCHVSLMDNDALHSTVLFCFLL